MTKPVVVCALLVLLASARGFAVKQPTLTSTPILGPTEEGEYFDSNCVANPVILPPADGDGEWQCYYYGNAGSWSQGLPSFLPTGSSGLAVSNDGGRTWTKVQGKEPGGSILAPTDDDDDGGDAWDAVQTGVGDVIRIDQNELHMYYFGGSKEGIEFPTMPGKPISGVRMRIGRAKSNDNGRTWVKDGGYLLDYDPSEGFFASWPRILVGRTDDEPWRMFYHAFDGKIWRVYSAESTDKGDTWTQTGLILEGGKEEGDFDGVGIGTRDVIRWRDGLLMIYEGVDTKSIHRIGAAYCPDGGEWTKLNDGKPILEPGVGPMGKWTSLVIGTPFVHSMPDGSLRLYHCAKETMEDKMKIGVVESKSGDVSPESWTAMDVNSDTDVQ